MLIDGLSGYATTPDSATISPSGDLDMRCYASLDNWTTSSAQFLLSKANPGTDASYQLFMLNGYICALVYSTAGATAAFQSTSLAPVTNGQAKWIRATISLSNGLGLAVGTFYTSSDGTTWTQLGNATYQLTMASVKDSAVVLELGRGTYPSGTVTFNQPLITCDAANFDGTNDYLTHGASALTGVSNSKKGIYSAWIRFNGGNGTAINFIYSNTAAIWIVRTAGNVLWVQGYNTGGSVILNLSTTNTYTSGSTWYHFLISWDLGAGAASIYVNDVSSATSSSITNDSIRYTETSAKVMFAGSTSGTNPSPVDAAEIYIAYGQYLDFTVTANRRKFISDSGKPVHLGTNGSIPTGTAPTIYFHLDHLESANNFGAINHGSSDAFTVNGSLTTSSGSPSD